MITIARDGDGVIVSTFDGAEWHRERFATLDELHIWAHQNGIKIGEITWG